MGLSNEERSMKIFHAVDRLNDDELRKVVRREDQALDGLLDRLWPTLLAGHSKGLYWLLGSGATDDCMEKLGLFQVAVIGNRELEEADASSEARTGMVRKDFKSDKEYTDWQKRCELVDYVHDLVPGLHRILERNEPFLAKVYEIYETCELILYASRRYRDDFAEGLSDLTSLVASIMGRCFHHFKTNSKVREAWYVAQIIKKLIRCSGTYDHDLIITWWFSQNTHHDLGMNMHSSEDLHKMFAEVQLKTEMTTEERVLLALWLLGRRFHYDHQFKHLLDMVGKHNAANPDDLVDPKKVTAQFKKVNKAQKTEYEDRGKVHEDYCFLTHQLVVRDYREKPAKKKKAGRKKN